jgi:hypothetical protein
MLTMPAASLAVAKLTRPNIYRLPEFRALVDDAVSPPGANERDE